MEVHNNKKLFRFQVVFDGGETALLEYRWKKGDMLLMRTYVPVAHRGKGVASLLAAAALDYARANNLVVQVFCPFIELFIQKNPKYSDVVRPNQ